MPKPPYVDCSYHFKSSDIKTTGPIDSFYYPSDIEIMFMSDNDWYGGSGCEECKLEYKIGK